MFSFMRWKEKRQIRHFKAVGVGCTFAGPRLEVKGRVYLGDRCTLHENIVFRTRKNGVIRLGNEVFVADYALFQANEAVTIGDRAYIGPYTILRDTNHLMKGTEAHWRLTPHITEAITIEADAYLAARSYVMPGVTIGAGAVIGPGSIVTKDVPPLEIWAGAPARRIAHRTDPDKRSRLKRDLALVTMFGVEEETETSPQH